MGRVMYHLVVEGGGRVHFQLSYQIFYAPLPPPVSPDIFSNPALPKIGDKKFMTPTPTHPLDPSNLFTHIILHILWPSTSITNTKYIYLQVNYSCRLMVCLFDCTFYLIIYAFPEIWNRMLFTAANVKGGGSWDKTPRSHNSFADDKAPVNLIPQMQT